MFEKSPLLKKSPGNLSEKYTTRRLTNFLKSISIEPAIFLVSFAEAGAKVFDLQLTIEKVCGNVYSSEICDNLDISNDTAAQNHVQEQTSDFNIYRHYLEYVPAIFISLILANILQSKYRYYGIIYPYVCFFIFCLAFLGNSLWNDTNPVFIVLSYIPLGLAGGVVTLFMSSYCIISDLSDTRSRSARISYIIGLKYLAFPVGVLASDIAYDYGGYPATFILQSCASFLAVVYVCVRFKYMLNEDSGRAQSLQGMCSFQQISKGIQITFKERNTGIRCQIIGYMFMIYLHVICEGSTNYYYLYTKKKFGWNSDNYTLWNMVDVPLSGLGAIISVPIMSYHLNMRDSIISMAGALSSVSYYLIIGFSTYPWMMFLASIGGILQRVVFASSRGRLSKLVEQEEVSAVFATTNILESTAPLVSSLVFGLFYNATLASYAGALFLLVAGIELLVTGIAVLFVRKH